MTFERKPKPKGVVRPEPPPAPPAKVYWSDRVRLDPERMGVLVETPELARPVFVPAEILANADDKPKTFKFSIRDFETGEPKEVEATPLSFEVVKVVLHPKRLDEFEERWELSWKEFAEKLSDRLRKKIEDALLEALFYHAAEKKVDR